MNAVTSPATDYSAVAPAPATAHDDRLRQARFSAATAPPCAVQAVITPLLEGCDLALYLDRDIDLPTYAYLAGDVLLVNQAIEPLPGDAIVVLLGQAGPSIVDHAEWVALKAAGRVQLSAVLLGYMRRSGLLKLS